MSTPASTSNTSTSDATKAPEPTIISGYEHARYANAPTTYAQERYQYMGKDEQSGEPQWVDYGAKGDRK